MSAAVHPFTPAFSDDAITQLHERLQRTRFPDPETVEDWSQGAPLSYIEELVTHWRADYDMRRVPAAMNQWPNFTTDIDGNGQTTMQDLLLLLGSFSLFCAE